MIVVPIQLSAQESCESFFGKARTTYKFENSHNTSLRKSMQQLAIYDREVRDFVDGLKTVIESKYLETRTTRNPEGLQRTILTTTYYHKAILILYKEADKLMMTPRIEMISQEKRTEFISRYKQSYYLYAELLTQLLTVFMGYREQNPADWNYEMANDILMKMDALMAEAHNKF